MTVLRREFPITAPRVNPCGPHGFARADVPLPVAAMRRIASNAAPHRGASRGFPTRDGGGRRRGGRPTASGR
ncbi:hypothetical protein ACH55_24080, partial [Salmonella enterica subsp. enterica serovar Typhimurium]